MLKSSFFVFLLFLLLAFPTFQSMEQNKNLVKFPVEIARLFYNRNHLFMKHLVLVKNSPASESCSICLNTFLPNEILYVHKIEYSALKPQEDFVVLEVFVNEELQYIKKDNFATLHPFHALCVSNMSAKFENPNLLNSPRVYFCPLCNENVAANLFPTIASALPLRLFSDSNREKIDYFLAKLVFESNLMHENIKTQSKVWIMSLKWLKQILKLPLAEGSKAAYKNNLKVLLEYCFNNIYQFPLELKIFLHKEFSCVSLSDLLINLTPLKASFTDFFEITVLVLNSKEILVDEIFRSFEEFDFAFFVKIYYKLCFAELLDGALKNLWFEALHKLNEKFSRSRYSASVADFYSKVFQKPKEFMEEKEIDWIFSFGTLITNLYGSSIAVDAIQFPYFIERMVSRLQRLDLNFSICNQAMLKSISQFKTLKELKICQFDAIHLGKNFQLDQTSPWTVEKLFFYDLIIDSKNIELITQIITHCSSNLKSLKFKKVLFDAAILPAFKNGLLYVTDKIEELIFKRCCDYQSVIPSVLPLFTRDKSSKLQSLVIEIDRYRHYLKPQDLLPENLPSLVHLKHFELTAFELSKKDIEICLQSIGSWIHLQSLHLNFENFILPLVTLNNSLSNLKSLEFFYLSNLFEHPTVDVTNLFNLLEAPKLLRNFSFDWTMYSKVEKSLACNFIKSLSNLESLRGFFSLCYFDVVNLMSILNLESLHAVTLESLRLAPTSGKANDYAVGKFGNVKNLFVRDLTFIYDCSDANVGICNFLSNFPFLETLSIEKIELRGDLTRFFDILKGLPTLKSVSIKGSWERSFRCVSVEESVVNFLISNSSLVSFNLDCNFNLSDLLTEFQSQAKGKLINLNNLSLAGFDFWNENLKFIEVVIMVFFPNLESLSLLGSRFNPIDLAMIESKIRGQKGRENFVILF